MVHYIDLERGNILCTPTKHLANRVSAILKALENAGVENWGIHAFMTAQSAELAGQTPREIIVDDSASLEDVLRAVERRYAGDQGAQ